MLDILFAGLEDGRICVWHAGVRQPPLGFLQSLHQSCVNVLSVVHLALIAGHESGDIIIWKINPLEVMSSEVWNQVKFHQDGIRAFSCCYSPSFALAHFPDHRPSVLLLSASADQNISLWNASGCFSTDISMPLVHFQTITESMSVNAVAVEWTFQGHGDGKSAQPPGHYDRLKNSHWLRIFTACGSGSWDRIIRIFSSDEDGLNLRQTGSLRGHEQPIDSLLILKPYGHVERFQEGLCRLLSTSLDGTIRLWDTHTNSQVISSLTMSSSVLDLVCLS